MVTHGGKTDLGFTKPNCKVLFCVIAEINVSFKADLQLTKRFGDVHAV